MDVNGSPFWQAASARAFGFGGSENASPQLKWDAGQKAVKLAGMETAVDFQEDEAFAREQLNRPAPVCDPKGSFAWWDGDANEILASGFRPGESLIAIPPDQPVGVPLPSDMAFDDDILFVARNGKILLVDMRDRWPPYAVSQNGFSAHLMAAVGDGNIWTVDQTSGQLARLSGRPMRTRGFAFEQNERFQPKPINPNPPRIEMAKGAVIPSPFEPVAMAGRSDGLLAILCWNVSDNAVVFLWDGKKLTQSAPLQNVEFPFSVAWGGHDTISILVSDGAKTANRAIAYDLRVLREQTAPLSPNGRVYPLIDNAGFGFCNNLSDVPQYLTKRTGEKRPSGLRRLRGISRPSYAQSGGTLLGPFDSSNFDSEWHRLYLEASVKGRSGIRIWAMATNRVSDPDLPEASDHKGWAAHIVGNGNIPTSGSDLVIANMAQASWCHHDSETSGHGGFSNCPKVMGQSGLFTVLLQHNARKVRRIKGRYLYLYVELAGDGMTSPELFALRVYGSRFSYRDRYLPELYGETLSGSDADAAGSASPPDFLDRFLHLFEGELTETEGRIAQSWRYSDPQITPDKALPWLAQWIGVDPAHDADMNKLRQKLASAPALAQMHGCLGGLRAMLEIESGGQLVRGGHVDPHRTVPRPGNFAQAEFDGKSVRSLVLSVSDPRSGGTCQILTGGGVTRGDIAIVEGYRLRRTFATILGADLADEDDPLTLGLVQSGNSFVGDSLILGDDQADQLLALFRDDLPKSLAERNAVENFLNKLAYRTLILVRDNYEPGDIARIERAANEAAPAHVAVEVIPSNNSFIAGVSSLVSIDTYLTDKPEAERFRLAQSSIGEGDIIEGEGQLDRRADGPAPGPPVAKADGPSEVMSDMDFTLSAARSRADTGRIINRYVWTWN